MAEAMRSIPVFALYGEGDAPADPGFVHIETIWSRSQLNDWEIRPHVHARMLQLLLVRRGHVSVTIDGVGATLDGPATVIAPPGVSHGFRFDPAVDGDVLSISPDLFSTATDDSPIAALLAGPGIIAMDDGAMRSIDALTGQLHGEAGAHRPGRVEMMGWLARALLLVVARRKVALADHAPAVARRTARFLKFRSLVEQDYRRRHDAAHYAGRMGMTERSLNRLCVAAVERTAKQVVLDRLALEARRQLAYTTAPVADIAYDLGFDDPAYFSRFYRRVTGSLPREHRRAF